MKTLTYVEQSKKQRGTRRVQRAAASAQQVVIDILQDEIDDSFTLLHNFPLAHTGISIPLLLVGPPGIKLLYPYAKMGSFRAREERLLVLKRGSFERARHNLISLCLKLAQAVSKYLGQRGLPDMKVEPILIFTHRRSQVNPARPKVRVMSYQGIANYGEAINEGSARISPQQIEAVVTILAGEQPPPPPEVPDWLAELGETASELEEVAAAQGGIADDSNLTPTQQGIILSLLGAFMLIFVIFFAFIIFNSF